MTATALEPAPGTIADRHLRSARELTAEQRKSQISDGHRLIRSVRARPFQLYSAREQATRAVALDAGDWLNTVPVALRAAVSRMAAARVDSALARARKRLAEYGVKRVGSAEAVAEALYDGKWFKTQRAHMERTALRDLVAAMLTRAEPVELIFPIFSRKPFSPVKNRGVSPDTAELHSLARCAALAHAVAALSPTGCRFTILADGHKYNRACRTPDDVVDAYQDTLRCWVRELGAEDVLRVVDYEEWIEPALDGISRREREEYYERRTRTLNARYGPAFSPVAPRDSLTRLAEGDEVGQQLAHTFWSIATSVNYASTGTAHGSLPEEPCYSDDYQRFYAHYVAQLSRSLDTAAVRRDLAVPYTGSGGDTGLHREMRREAWKAACRYVAISLTDRELNLIKETAPRAVKLTIHGKTAELHFTTAASRDANMTAQHSTGGYALTGGQARPTFRYRIEREAAAETPVLLHGAVGRSAHDPRFRPLARLERMQQPVAYVDDPSPLLNGTFHQMLETLEI